MITGPTGWEERAAASRQGMTTRQAETRTNTTKTETDRRKHKNIFKTNFKNTRMNENNENQLS